MDMREKIARAIDPPAYAEGTDKPHWQKAALEAADRVLEAMRDADFGMAVVGGDAWNESEGAASQERAYAAIRVWQAMIDLARNPPIGEYFTNAARTRESAFPPEGFVVPPRDGEASAQD